MVPWIGLFANCCLISGGWWLAGHGLGQTRSLERILATAVLALSWCVLGIEVLGSIGLLAIGPLVVWSGILCIVGLTSRIVWPLPPQPSARRHNQDGKTQSALRWYAVIGLGLVLWTAAVLGMQSLLLPVKVVSDGPIYHLYFAARWWKAGRLFLVAAPFGENAATYFPANGDLWFTWLMATWGGDRLARVGQVPFLFLAAAAVFGVGRSLGASRDSTLLAASWFATSTPLLIFSFEANVDSIFVACYLVAVYFFLRHATRDGGTPALLLGGLASGLALGTKPVGVVFIPPLLLLASGAIGALSTSARKGMALVLIMLAGAALTSGFWYGRNLILTGNPLYPLHVSFRGMTILQGWYGREAMQHSPYYIPIWEWRALLDTLTAVLDPRLLPVWLAALAGAWAWRRDRPDRADRWVWSMSLLALLNVALWWICIPYRTQQRFFLQAVGLAAVSLARLVDRGVWLGRAATALLAIHLVTPQPWPWPLRQEDIPWDLSSFIPNVVAPPLPLLRLVEQSGRLRWEWASAGNLFLLLGAGLCAMLASWAITRLPQAEIGYWRTRGMGLVAILGLIVFAALETGAVGADPRDLVHPGFRDFYRGWQNLESRSGPGGARIAYAGTNIPFYLLGGALRNEVYYVNIDSHRTWMLHDYHRAAVARGDPIWPNARPGWDRANPDFLDWLANLRSLGIQLLVVTKVNPGEGPHNVADTEGFPIERVWADQHPEFFEPLYGRAEHDPFFRIYRVRPID
jgi:hypothetical protein